MDMEKCQPPQRTAGPMSLKLAACLYYDLPLVKSTSRIGLPPIVRTGAGLVTAGSAPLVLAP